MPHLFKKHLGSGLQQAPTFRICPEARLVHQCVSLCTAGTPHTVGVLTVSGSAPSTCLFLRTLHATTSACSHALLCKASFVRKQATAMMHGRQYQWAQQSSYWSTRLISYRCRPSFGALALRNLLTEDESPHLPEHAAYIQPQHDLCGWPGLRGRRMLMTPAPRHLGTANRLGFRQGGTRRGAYQLPAPVRAMAPRVFRTCGCTGTDAAAIPHGPVAQCLLLLPLLPQALRAVLERRARCRCTWWASAPAWCG
jgi:hypothetical protein